MRNSKAQFCLPQPVGPAALSPAVYCRKAPSRPCLLSHGRPNELMSFPVLRFARRGLTVRLFFTFTLSLHYIVCVCVCVSQSPQTCHARCDHQRPVSLRPPATVRSSVHAPDIRASTPPTLLCYPQSAPLGETPWLVGGRGIRHMGAPKTPSASGYHRRLKPRLRPPSRSLGLAATTGTCVCAIARLRVVHDLACMTSPVSPASPVCLPPLP